MYWSDYLATDMARKKQVTVPELGIRTEVFPVVLIKDMEISGVAREKKQIAFWTNSKDNLGYSFSPSFLGKNVYLINSNIKSTSTERAIAADSDIYIVNSELENVRLNYSGTPKKYAMPKKSALILNSSVQNTQIRCEGISVNNAKIRYSILEGKVEIAPQNGCSVYLNSLRVVDTNIKNVENVEFVCPIPIGSQKGYLKWYLPMKNTSIKKQTDFVSERCTICDEPKLSDMYSLMVIYQPERTNKVGVFTPGQNVYFSSNSVSDCLDKLYEHRYGEKICRKNPIVSYLMLPGVIEGETLRANPNTQKEMVQLYANFLGLIYALVTKSCDEAYMKNIQNELRFNIKTGMFAGFSHPFQIGEKDEKLNVFPKIKTK